jgi:hypothetical protein
MLWNVLIVLVIYHQRLALCFILFPSFLCLPSSFLFLLSLVLCPLSTLVNILVFFCFHLFYHICSILTSFKVVILFCIIIVRTLSKVWIKEILFDLNVVPFPRSPNTSWWGLRNMISVKNKIAIHICHFDVLICHFVVLLMRCCKFD